MIKSTKHQEINKLSTKSALELSSSNMSKDTHRVIRFDDSSRPLNYILDIDSIQKSGDPLVIDLSHDDEVNPKNVS